MKECIEEFFIILTVGIFDDLLLSIEGILFNSGGLDDRILLVEVFVGVLIVAIDGGLILLISFVLSVESASKSL